MKRAFTLIELLVVIAIIAILAAILFPVFAQAKAAAKGTASLSNSKQLGLGAIMYAGDADDTFPLATVWNSGNDPLTFAGGDGCSPWSWLVQPYIKNGGIYDDPTNTPTPSLGPGISVNLSKIFIPQYGYNYTYLSPIKADGDGNPYQAPVSSTQAGDPAGTVMFTSKWSYGESATANTGFWSYGPQSPAFWTTIEVPDCSNAPDYCSSNWGKNDGFVNSATYEGVTKYEAGAFTGGVSLHATESAIVAFTDGHSKKMKPSALAAGTNWYKDIESSATTTTDKTKYLWDLE
jgi:prepilin-type N-terminal cleavage/methylation domain-containing protein